MFPKKPNAREKRHRLSLESYRGIIAVSFTACVEGSKQLFVTPEIVDLFLERLRKGLTKYQCLAPIYCLMPDHAHIVVQGVKAESDTWKAMVAFKQQTGYWLAAHRPAFEWQKDVYDHIIRTNEDLGNHIRYVANNPVRAGLVRAWNDYPFTGAIGIDLRSVMEDVTTC